MSAAFNRTRLIAVLLAGLLCLGANGPFLGGTVARVVDGDTLVVQLTSGRIRVRLYGIDAPEHDQPGGAEATAALQSLVGRSPVQLEVIGQDRYARMVARVIRGGLDVNSEMVREGYAWVYRNYLQPQDRSWCELERQARRLRRGLWAQPGAIPPWDFRHHTQGPPIPPCP
ncbi:MAG TPA: thermonuclease family protein [Steroidobacteraceae bacterium]